ncbi:DUF167 domain-containing protein [uncultured Methanoregula sp.]|uniref:DUF167 domain-containing protein n=1 Tax=uncultured Methanoregula sp. TaxID=1005933 RepID=UPI002AAA989A|nr:DUF167 domain-containing protein [uncultured Methanoregula sp.]
MPDIADALMENRQGTILAIEVTAGAKKNVFPDGYNTWRKTIGCRVSAEAVDGKANRAILQLVSETLDIPVSAVSLQSGATSSQKKLLITGLSRCAVLDRLQART